ncbi:hypothetical protein [Fundidesulfovibrio agrisoli]|uniref:hypothetical protein n=1 Tax=Fundidesulfovibrio agrisoli TaxID=2922717 RepID=UPI001FAB757C|nr:hypothetical protein [Fundidesulfovibrio agrisoli]
MNNLPNKTIQWLCSHKPYFFVSAAILFVIVFIGAIFDIFITKHFEVLTWVRPGIIFVATLIAIGLLDFYKVFSGRQNVGNLAVHMTIWGILINPTEQCFLWLHYILRVLGVPTNTGGKLEVEAFSSSMAYSLRGIPGTLIYAAVFGVAIALLNRSVVWYLRRKDRAAGRA